MLPSASSAHRPATQCARCARLRLDRLGQQRLDQRALLLGDHGEQEARRHAHRCRRPPAASACATRLRLQAVEAARQGGALVGRVQQPLAAVALARLLLDPALVHQLLEHAGQALLGDLQDLEQVGDAQARMAVDEVQHAVMRAPEAELGQDGVGLAREVAIGEEQQLDEGDEMGVGARRGRSARPLVNRRPMPAQELGIYVSHVDLFDPDC